MSNVISYNGVYLEPAPFVSFTKTYVNNGSGGRIGASYSIRVNGTLIKDKGSFNDSLDGRDGFCAITYKIHKLKELFAQNHKEFVWIANDSTYLRFYPTIESVDIEEGNMVNICNYTITMTAPEIIWTDGNEDFNSNANFFSDEDGDLILLKNASETWSVEPISESSSATNPYTYRITHSLRAEGIDYYCGSDPILQRSGWISAKQWIDERKKTTAQMMSEVTTNLLVFDLPSEYTTAYDHIISTRIDESGGAYSLDETWLITERSTTETFNISCSKNDGKLSVSINGTIKGLVTETSYGEPDVSDTKYDQALSYWNNTVKDLLYSRCNAILTNDDSLSDNYILNTSPINTTVAHNELLGTISYTYQYETSTTNLVDNSIREYVRCSAQMSGSKYASITVLGRADGPILQDLNTVTSQSISANISILMPAYGGSPTTNLITLFDTNSPRSQVTTNYVTPMHNSLTSAYTQVFKESDQDDYDENSGQYTRMVKWTFQ